MLFFERLRGVIRMRAGQLSLFSGFFQLGYVTRNAKAAIAQFQKQYQAIEFMDVPVEVPDDVPKPAVNRMALGYIDELMVEIVEVDPSQESIFLDALPPEPGDLRLHHLGYLIDDFAATLQRAHAAGYAVPLQGSVPELGDYAYTDTRSHLGHYSEYIRLNENGKRWFDAVPRAVGNPKTRALPK
jgi:hypothetical protein